MNERGRTDEERDYYALNERVYAWFAPCYEYVVFPLRRLRHEVAALAQLDARSRVLDVATGTGAQARAFAERAGEVVGIDIAEPMLRIAREQPPRPNLSFRHADATALPFADASFDLSCISFALHEMPKSIREQVIAEMVRVTAPDGTIIVVDYRRPPGTFGTALHHLVRLYERDHYVDFIAADLRALLERNGIAWKEERSALLGAARIVVGSRSTATRRPSVERHERGHIAEEREPASDGSRSRLRSTRRNPGPSEPSRTPPGGPCG